MVGRGFGMGVGRQGTVAECRRAGAVRNVRCGSRQAHGAEGWRSLREPRRTQRREERPLSQALTGGCGSCCFLHMGCWHFLRRNVSSSRGSFRLGVSHRCLLRALPFRLPRSAVRLEGRELRAARLGPFSCGLGAVCAFVRFPIAVFQYAASGLLVLDRYFWFFDAGFRFSTTDFELSATDFDFRLQSYQALSTCSIPKCGYFSPLIRIGMHKSGY